MYQKILYGCLLGIGIASCTSIFAATGSEVQVVTNCNGTQIVRTDVGTLEVRYGEVNLPGCVGTNVMAMSGTLAQSRATQPTDTQASETVLIQEVVNCNGLKITSYPDGRYTSTHVRQNLPGCVGEKVSTLSKIMPNLSEGPLFDIRSTDIMNYRNELLRKQGIRFANAIRSVRMRNAASMEARTNAYLMKNDAVVISGKETGWVKVQGAELFVSDAQENTVGAKTSRKARGYTASKYLRNPNTTDLVRIGQADHAYWSDVARVKVEHLVNVRSNPWHTAPIVTTLRNNTPLYVVSTVDNRSEVRNESGTIRGYIRSDYVQVEKAQRVDNPNTAKTSSSSSASEEVPDSSWIAF